MTHLCWEVVEYDQRHEINIFFVVSPVWIMAEIWVVVEEHRFRVPHVMIDSICFRGENELGLFSELQHALAPPVLDSRGRHGGVRRSDVVVCRSHRGQFGSFVGKFGRERGSVQVVPRGQVFVTMLTLR
jgi:hypothetical protein